MQGGFSEFQIMPVGLYTATFKRKIDTVVAGVRWQTCLPYLDEVVALFCTSKEHLHRMTTVLEAIIKASV